jgi:hypothetical protein
MENQAHALRQGQGTASGAASITVEKHKINFLTQYGTFEDKPSQNIARWLGKADTYRTAHMIESLEMGSIIIHCIKGEPARKVRRMLDVPGVSYVHANYYCEQQLQRAVEYQPYREHRAAGQEPELIPEGEPNAGQENPLHGQQQAQRDARPAILPVRYQPAVAPNHYLLTIYGKRVNLTEAEKFLSTFKTQKPKQTCSNYLDEFVINYENYANQRWTNLQLNGIPGDTQAEPPVLPVIGNAIARQADMLQIVTDGICKEFKIHCDNIQLDLTTTTFHNLEIAVQQWQRSTTTGKAFTSACNPAFDNVNVSAMDIVNTLEEDKDKLALMDSQTNSPHVSSASTRGQRGGRGGRGAGRGGRGRGGRGRGAGSNTSNQAIKGSVVQSRDMQDGGYHNYRQAQDGTLHKSIHGHPLCNYCGIPSHKREKCTVKATDRGTGLTRIFHPDRDKAISNHEKTKAVTATVAREAVAAAMAAANMPPTPPMQYQPWQPWTVNPWTVAPPAVQQQQPIQGAINQWQQPQTGQDVQALINAARVEHDRKVTATTQATASANGTTPSPCPYPTCHAILSDQYIAQEHMRMFHNQPSSMAAGPGFTP